MKKDFTLKALHIMLSLCYRIYKHDMRLKYIDDNYYLYEEIEHDIKYLICNLEND